MPFEQQCERVLEQMKLCMEAAGSSLTQVPVRLLNEDRTCMGTSYRRAYSTQRNCRTFAPDAAISSISSYLIAGIRRAHVDALCTAGVPTLAGLAALGPDAIIEGLQSETLAGLVEQAGGRASTGTERVLDLQASDYHQRAAIIVGSPDDVALAEKFYADN